MLQGARLGACDEGCLLRRVVPASEGTRERSVSRTGQSVPRVSVQGRIYTPTLWIGHGGFGWLGHALSVCTVCAVCLRLYFLL
jgi:transposase InsO family protein